MLLLRRGDKGAMVRLLQERLNYHGSYLGIDGEFGLKTERVLRDFQFSWNLLVDGVCGDRTWGCLLQQKGLNQGSVRLRRKIPHLMVEALRERGGSELGLGLCEAALMDVGKEENPWGSNKGDKIAHLVQGTRITGEVECEYSEYKRHWGISGTTFFPPWCAIAVSGWLAELYEATSWSEIPFGNWFGGVTQTMKWGDKYGALRRDVGECSAGELFVMPRAGSKSDGDEEDGVRNVRGGHIGIVLWDDGESVQTVEGNTQNGVRSRSRKKDTLWGIVDWELALKNK
jgi:hypothetical protein